jgi:hypothetical protein
MLVILLFSCMCSVNGFVGFSLVRCVAVLNIFSEAKAPSSGHPLRLFVVVTVTEFLDMN